MRRPPASRLPSRRPREGSRRHRCLSLLRAAGPGCPPGGGRRFLLLRMASPCFPLRRIGGAAPSGVLPARLCGPVTAGRGASLGARLAAVVPGAVPGGALPGFRHVAGRHLAQAFAVFRAKVNLVGLSIEPERPGLDVFSVAAHVAGQRYLSDRCHRPDPCRPLIIDRQRPGYPLRSRTCLGRRHEPTRLVRGHHGNARARPSWAATTCADTPRSRVVAWTWRRSCSRATGVGLPSAGTAPRFIC